jgi:8-oxo-dGTP pyrophosphatase MutT (NUDIX family)
MASPDRFIRQAAAIPLRDGQLCLVTSSSRKRWVIPKGMIDPGKTPAEIALQEAWEEAGLLGTLGPPLGTYQYKKYGGTCLVTVFSMQVYEARDDWPERTVRRRVWLALEEALALIEEEGLREIMRRAAVEAAVPSQT